MKIKISLSLINTGKVSFGDLVRRERSLSPEKKMFESRMASATASSATIGPKKESPGKEKKKDSLFVGGSRVGGCGATLCRLHPGVCRGECLS